jgi:hypothetical protein
MPKTNVKDLQSTQTFAKGTHGYVSNVPRHSEAHAEDNAAPSSFPITSR